MKYLLVYLFSVLAFTQALASNTVAVNDPSCALSKSDPYETPTRVGSGSALYAGQCLDTDRFRPAILVEENDEYIKFANYKHEDKYWTATLKKNAQIAKVYFQVVRFDVVTGVTAAHTQFRVIFQKGSEIELSLNTDASVKAQIQDLVVSYEASRPNAQEIPYNFAHGFIDNYISVARVMSGVQRLAESTENTTEQYELNFPLEEDKMALVLGAIEQSSKEKFSRFYNTLKPNCTTEVFDLIDRLPSQKNKGNEPFLTVISNDPVAGPSVTALKERKILKARYANFRDDVELGKIAPPVDEIKTSKERFLPEIEGSPYSLVFSVPEQGDQKLLKVAKETAYQLVPKLAQAIGSSLMLADSSLLMSSLNTISESMKGELKNINSKLSDEPTVVTLYFIPWDQSGKKVDVLKEMNVPAKLPFKAFEITTQNIYKVSASIQKASEVDAENPKAFGVLGAAVQLYLVKDASQITIQVIGNLGPQTKSLEVSNDQVDITQFVIEEASRATDQSIALINFSQLYGKDEPNLQIQFGPFGGLAGDLVPANYGKLQVMTGASCRVQAAATPQMHGKLTLLGWVKWKSVSFNIFSVDVDIKEQLVENMDVRVFTLPFSCISKDDVNKQFAENANTQIQDLKDNMSEKGEALGLSLINKIFSNNSEEKISGMR